MEDLIKQAKKHLEEILRDAMCMMPGEQTLVLFDAKAPLSQILIEAYRRAIPDALFVDFATVTPENIFQYFDQLKPKDLVVLVQSTNFRLNEFRLRIELFERRCKTIEHIHLERMDESQFETYIDALAYDPMYYRSFGHALKSRLDQAERIVVECAGTRLVYSGEMEETKLNIGDYSQIKNIGGTFPIGEVFTEAKDLKTVNGEALVFGFAGEDHKVRTYEPFLISIQEGILTAPHGPAEFQTILDLIKQDEDVVVREFGLGLNRAMNKTHIVNDITAFERQLGLHLSLGAKHAMYKKPGFSRKKGRYHVDIFIDAKKILIDDACVFQEGTFSL